MSDEREKYEDRIIVLEQQLAEAKRQNLRQRVEDLFLNQVVYTKNGKYDDSGECGIQFSIYDDLQDKDGWEQACDRIGISYKSLEQFTWQGSQDFRDSSEWTGAERYYTIPIDEFIDWLVEKGVGE